MTLIIKECFEKISIKQPYFRWKLPINHLKHQTKVNAMTVMMYTSAKLLLRLAAHQNSFCETSNHDIKFYSLLALDLTAPEILIFCFAYWRQCEWDIGHSYGNYCRQQKSTSQRFVNGFFNDCWNLLCWRKKSSDDNLWFIWCEKNHTGADKEEWT